LKLPLEPLAIHPWLPGHLLVAACVLLSFTSPCAAAWPDRSITIVVGAAPGGTGDQAARIISEKLGAELGTTIVVENKAAQVVFWVLSMLPEPRPMATQL